MTSKAEKLVLPFINAIESVEKVLSCAICLETPSEPIETRCGHLFCNICIQQILNRPGESCPLCKLVLTRRNVMSGSQMELCVRKLWNLIDAIRTDTDIDMRVCLKMHYEKRSAILFPNDSEKTKQTLPQVAHFDKDLPRDSRDLNSPKRQNPIESDDHDDLGEDGSNDNCKLKKAPANNKDLSKQEASINIEIVQRPRNNRGTICNAQQLESLQKEIETATPITTNKTSKLVARVSTERHDNKFVTETTTTDQNISEEARTEKTIEISNEKDKQLPFNKHIQVSNNMLQSDVQKLRKSTSPKGFLAVSSAANTVSKVKSLETVQAVARQRTVPSSTIVRFEKLGHLCKASKKIVTFLYFGATKRKNSSLFSESNSNEIRQITSSSQLTKEIRNEFSSLHRIGEMNQRLGLRNIDSYVENTFISRVRMISPQSYSELPRLPVESRRQEFPMPLPSFPVLRESEKISSQKAQSTQGSLQSKEKVGIENCKLILSPKIKRKRKRSESLTENSEPPSDSENQFIDQRFKKKMGTTQVCTETRQTYREDCDMNVAMPLQILESQAIEKVQNTAHNLNTSKQSNIRDKLSEPIPDNTRNSHKNHDYTRMGVLVDQGYSSPPNVIAQTSKYDKHYENNEIIASQNSLMNITDEELLLKKFENDLFGPKKLDNIPQPDQSKSRQGVIDLCKENTQDTSRMIEPTLSQARQKPSSQISETDCEQLSRNADVVDLGVATPSCSSVDNDVKPILHGDMSSTFSDIQSVVDRHREFDTETPSTSIRGKSKLNERRIRSGARRYAKLKPIYQSTPKSSHQNPIDRLTPQTHRQSQIEPGPWRTAPKNNSIANSRKLEPPVDDRLCIICSGLSSKQIDKVKFFSTLFGAKYTHNFSDDVTHLIVKTDDNSNAAYKTLKYLQGIASRKWVLNYNWILECIAQRKILGEEAYEVVDNTTLFPGPKRARLGDPGPFEKFIVFCVPPFMNMSVTDCEDLLRRTGATVVGSFDELAAEKSLLKVFVVQADCHENKIIDWHKKTKAVGVDPSWIVECISQYRVVSFFPFLQELLPQDVLDLGFPPEMVKDDDMDFMYEL